MALIGIVEFVWHNQNLCCRVGGVVLKGADLNWCAQMCAHEH